VDQAADPAPLSTAAPSVPPPAEPGPDQTATAETMPPPGDAVPAPTPAPPSSTTHAPAGSQSNAGEGAERAPATNGAAGTTASQLRRFIRSRPYVPMHELRRRFALNGGADEMIAVDVDGQQLWIGLPAREGRLLGDLLRGGDVGYEVSVDPVTPVIVGVYALKSIPRA
jgi:hypothetical protein